MCCRFLQADSWQGGKERDQESCTIHFIVPLHEKGVHGMFFLWIRVCGIEELSRAEEGDALAGSRQERWVNSGSGSHELAAETKGAQREEDGYPLLLNSSAKDRAEKEEVLFASGNLINWLRKWKSVHPNGAVIDRWFSLRCPSGEKVHSTLVERLEL